MQLGSCIAVAVVQAGSCSSDLTPSLGTSIGHGYGPKKKKKKKKKRKEKNHVCLQVFCYSIASTLISVQIFSLGI